MKVSIFTTCLVDEFFPNVGEATVELLERLGVEVTFNREQTCCGQPAFNTGYRRAAEALAARMLELFEYELQTADYIVAPSGSCTAMVKKHYPQLFQEAESQRRAKLVAARVYELSQFLVEVLGVEDTGASYDGVLTYHDSCHLLRELEVASGPRKLIAAVEGAEFRELDHAATCCGFGGTFSVKYPDISAAIAGEKAAMIERSGAECVVACDVSCLMHMRSALAHRGSTVRCLHLAELLSAAATQPQ